MESTRERILRISTELFAKNGFQGTGLAELSAAVELGRGALYHHIISKDQLHADIAYKPIRRAVAAAKTILAEQLPPADTILALSNEVSRDIMANLAQWMVWFREFSSLPSEDQERILELRTEYIEVWETAIEAGLSNSDFTNHSPAFLDGLLPMFIYANMWQVRRHGEAAASPIGDELGKFVLAALGFKEQSA